MRSGTVRSGTGTELRSPYELVIFDCDGVLVDSEPIANRVFAALLAREGLHLSEDEVMQRFVGRTKAGCMALAGEMLGRPLSPGFGAGRRFTASEVPRPKPAPDLFLHAAIVLGADPARCAVVEDTPTGVRAARAARMAAFGYAGSPHTSVAALEAEGAQVFYAMNDLATLLR